MSVRLKETHHLAQFSANTVGLYILIWRQNINSSAFPHSVFSHYEEVLIRQNQTSDGNKTEFTRPRPRPRPQIGLKVQ